MSAFVLPAFCKESLRGLTPYRLRGSRLVPFESLNLRLSDPERMSRSPVQDSLGIDFVRFLSRPCVSARRLTFELHTGETLARFPAACSQNGALISNLRSACRLAQSAVNYVWLFLSCVFWPTLSPRSLPDLGEAIDFFRNRDSSGSEPAPWGSFRSGSAASCVGLRCLFLVAIVRRPGPDANFLVLRKRFLNLGGRCRAADQTLASLTLVPLCPGSGIPDSLISGECVATVSVASRCSHELSAAQPTHLGSQAMHLTRQIPWRSRSRSPSARTAVA